MTQPTEQQIEAAVEAGRAWLAGHSVAHFAIGVAREKDIRGFLHVALTAALTAAAPRQAEGWRYQAYTIVADSIAAIEQGSTSAPVVEALRYALSLIREPDAPSADGE